MSFPRTLILSGFVIAQPILVWAFPINDSREFKDTIARSSPTTFSQNFLGGFPVHVVLSSHCYIDLNLYIYDNDGQLVAKADGPACFEQLTFTPKKTSRFEIVVKGEGSMAGLEYELTIESQSGKKK